MKKQYSRKRRALRNLLLLACLVLAMHCLNLYNFTSGTALRDRERELGIGETKPIASADYTDAMTAVLSGWEDRLLVTEQRWSLLEGWRVDNSWLHRRDADQPIQLEANASGNVEATYLWLCGWVADPDVTELQLRIRCRQWYGTKYDDPDVYLTVSDFQTWQGERVFMLTSRDIPATYTVHQIYLVTEQGEELLFQQ